MGRILIPFHITGETLSSNTYYELINLYQKEKDFTDILSPYEILEWARNRYKEQNINHFFNYWFPEHTLPSMGSAPCLEELFNNFNCPMDEDSAELCDKCYKETLYIY